MNQDGYRTCSAHRRSAKIHARSVPQKLHAPTQENDVVKILNPESPQKNTPTYGIKNASLGEACRRITENLTSSASSQT